MTTRRLFFATLLESFAFVATIAQMRQFVLHHQFQGYGKPLRWHA